jgi:hypothetical protein
MTRQVTVEAENPAEALRNQIGTFRAVSPDGHVFRFTCQTGRNLRIREVGGTEGSELSEVAHHDRFDETAHRRKWLIERIA